MFCEKCGKELRDGAKFCSRCGTAVKQETMPEKQAGSQEPDRKVKKKTQKIVFVIILAIFFILLCGAGFLFWWNGTDKFQMTHSGADEDTYDEAVEDEVTESDAIEDEIAEEHIDVEAEEQSEAENNNQIEEEICDAIHNAGRFAWSWFWENDSAHVDKSDTYIEYDEMGYKWIYERVTYEGIKSVEDVKDLTKHYYTAEIAEKLINQKGWYEYNGIVYVSVPDGLGGIDPDYYDIVIKKDSDVQYTIIVYAYYFNELMSEPYEVHYKLIDGYWVFDHVFCQMRSEDVPINILEQEITNESMNIIGTWKNEGYNEIEGWATSYKTVFNLDGTVIQEGWRNKDTGTYEISEDGKYIIAYYFENYIDFQEGWQLVEDYEYTVTYEIDADNECLYTQYSEEFKEALMSNAEDGMLIR